jgi:hypothetical protein
MYLNVHLNIYVVSLLFKMKDSDFLTARFFIAHPTHTHKTQGPCSYNHPRSLNSINNDISRINISEIIRHKEGKTPDISRQR